MYRSNLRNAARWLLAVLLGLLLLWLALPRLLGLAAEHWLDIPGLETLHVDIEKIDAGQARLREARAVYLGTGGQRFQIALHDIALDYSMVRRHLDRLDIASGELTISPGQKPQASPWPELDLPNLPLSQARIADLRIIVNRPDHPPLEAQGNFHLQQSAGQWLAEFRPDAGLLRLTATQARPPGDALEFHAEWLPIAGPTADARLTIGRQPEQQPARLIAHAPLPLLTELGRIFGISVPLTAAHGTLALTAEAQLGETSSSLRSLSGEAEFTDARLELTGMATPLTLALTGKSGFAWQAETIALDLHPGLQWQVSADGEQPLHASGRLDKPFAIRLADGATLSDSEFPFTIRSPQWGEWNGALQRLDLNGGTTLTDWKTADVQLRIKGQLKRWQQGSIQMRNLKAAGKLALHWSESAEIRGEAALQVDLERLSLAGDSPLNVSKSSWKLNAGATAKADGDFWESLTVHGEASSPRLNLQQSSGQSLSLGPSRLKLLTFRPAGPQGAKGELSIQADAIRVASWPAPDLRARLNINGNALRADGTLHLQGTEVLRFVGSHALSRGCGESTLTTRLALPTLGKLLQPRPPALLPLDFQAGAADARFAVDWCIRPNLRFEAKGTLQANDVALSWERARLEAVQLKLQLDGLQPLRGRIQLAAQRGELATGTPLADLSIDITRAAETLAVHTLHVNVLGGSIHSPPLKLPWPPLEQTVPLEIRRIDLGQLLALPKVQGLSGSGQISGVLPIVYRDGGVEINDGQLNSQGPGTIKYAPTVAISDNIGLQALRNFHFQELGMHAWYASDGAYRTQARLEGNNPDLYSGYPILFRLNINGKLPGLFRSAVFSGDFNRHILEQLQSGKLE